VLNHRGIIYPLLSNSAHRFSQLLTTPIYLDNDPSHIPLLFVCLRYEETVDNVIDRLEFTGGLDKMGLDFGENSLNLLDNQKV